MVPFLLIACAPTLAPTETSVVTQPRSPIAEDAAALSIRGSGRFCGPWWYGCGAVLAIEAPGWTLPDDWTMSAEDTQFAVDLDARSERPARVTGVRQQGLDRIEPGDYRLVVVQTMTPDTLPATTSSSVLCSVDLHVPAGTQAVSVDVEFGYGCTIAALMDIPSSAPSS